MRLFPLLVILLVSLPFHGKCADNRLQFLGIRADRAMRLEGLQVPLGAENSACGSRVSFETITIQSKRVGGLQIGLLPELRIEGMNLRLASDAVSGEWAEEMHRLLKHEPLLQSATITHLSISQPDGSPMVEAGQAGISRDATRLELKNVRIAGESKKIPAAQLVLAGRNAGSLLIGNKRHPLNLAISEPPEK